MKLSKAKSTVHQSTVNAAKLGELILLRDEILVTLTKAKEIPKQHQAILTHAEQALIELENDRLKLISTIAETKKLLFQPNQTIKQAENNLARVQTQLEAQRRVCEMWSKDLVLAKDTIREADAREEARKAEEALVQARIDAMTPEEKEKEIVRLEQQRDRDRQIRKGMMFHKVLTPKGVTSVSCHGENCVHCQNVPGSAR